jgi:septal ring factor EnvC (AmiA/AmiB activator)
MNKKQLRQELENFNEKLEEKQNIDHELKSNLKKLMQDISGFLDNSEEISSEEKDSLVENLKEAEMNFETKHPELSESLNIIFHTLSNMGI